MYLIASLNIVGDGSNSCVLASSQSHLAWVVVIACSMLAVAALFEPMRVPQEGEVLWLAVLSHRCFVYVCHSHAILLHTAAPLVAISTMQEPASVTACFAIEFVTS